MPIPILGKDVANYMRMDPTLVAMRGTPRPMECNKSWFSLGAKSGALTTVTGGAPVFVLQNLSINLVAVRKLQICFSLNTAFGAAQYLDFGLKVGRSISTPASGGTAIVLSGAGANCKLSSEGLGCTAINCRISTTGALTAGTRTLDTNYLGQCGVWAGAVGTMLPLTVLLDQGPGEYPLVLDQNEGIEIHPVTTMGATGAGVLGVNVEFLEVTSALF